MMIKKELSVSGRKKAEVTRDLKAKGFKSFPKVTKAAVEDERPVEEAEEVEDDSTNGYGYLLGVSVKANSF